MRNRNWDTSVGVAVGWVARVRFPAWQDFSPQCPDRLWGPPSLQWVLGALSLGVKWPGREADLSSPSSAPICVHGILLNLLSTGTTLTFYMQKTIMFLRNLENLFSLYR
jgi:hypothetical protein